MTRWLLTLAPLLAASVSVAEQRLPRPPRLPTSPRHFGRTLCPIQPGTSVALEAGQVWAGVRDGVELEQIAVGFVAEASYRRLGLFLEAPLVFDRVRTEGVYGQGDASARGAGDLAFGARAWIRSFRLLGRRWELGSGLHVTAPTGGDRWVQPEAPLLSAPRHRLGPARWTTSVSPAVGGWIAPKLALQLEAGLVLHVVDDRNAPGFHNRWLFAAVGLAAAYRPLPWLTPLLALDTQLEMYGRQHSLRQLAFAMPAIRVALWRRVAVDIGLRIPLTGETWDEHRLSLAVTVSLGLGPGGDDAW